VKRNDFFAFICDEVTGEARQQHLGISIRWIDADFAINEDFLGLYAISKADAEWLTGLIQDVLLRFTLDIPKCQGSATTVQA